MRQCQRLVPFQALSTIDVTVEPPTFGACMNNKASCMGLRTGSARAGTGFGHRSCSRRPRPLRFAAHARPAQGSISVTCSQRSRREAAASARIPPSNEDWTPGLHFIRSLCPHTPATTQRWVSSTRSEQTVSSELFLHWIEPASMRPWGAGGSAS